MSDAATHSKEAGTTDAPALQLPHSPPWIFVDRIDAVDGHDAIQATRRIVDDDPFVRAHFGGRGQIFPGVLLIEMVGQVATLLQAVGPGRNEALTGKAVPPVQHVLGRCKASFHSPARVGDLLTICVRRQDTVGSATLFRGSISCDGRPICTVELLGATLTE